MNKRKRLYVNVWDRCNLNCRHCFNEGGKIGGEILTAQEIVKFVREARKCMGISEVQITGGEPSLRPDIFPLADDLIQSGVRVLMQTNGVFDPIFRERLLSLPPESLMLIISLDGIKTNDYLRGERATRQTVENIKTLSRKFEIRVNTVISSESKWHDMEGIAALAGKHNLSVAFNPICPSGRSEAAMLMHPDLYFDWMFRLETFRERGIRLRKSFDIVDGRLVEYEKCPVRRGGAIHINADGGVHACGFLVGNASCHVGSIREHTLPELLNRISEAPTVLAERCRQCGFHKNGCCNGGCPARIFALNGKFDAVEFYCMADYHNQRNAQ